MLRGTLPPPSPSGWAGPSPRPTTKPSRDIESPAMTLPIVSSSLVRFVIKTSVSRPTHRDGRPIRRLRRRAAALRDQKTLVPGGTSESGASRMTSPDVPSGTPSTSTSDRKLAICRGGKLVTATTSAGQFRWRVTRGDLSAGPLLPQCTEVNQQLVGGLAGLRELLGPQDPADPDVGTEELVRGHLRRLAAQPNPQVSRFPASLKLTARTEGELSSTTPMSTAAPRCASKSRQ